MNFVQESALGQYKVLNKFGHRLYEIPKKFVQECVLS